MNKISFMPSSMTRPHAFWVPLVFAVFSLINVAHAQDCAPSGSVDILVELGADTVDLQLHVDTAATAGFDAGLDSLCQVDSTAAYACLSLDTTLYVTASLPPNGETALSFDLLVQSDTIAPVVTFDLGEWLLLAATAWWVLDGDTTEVDLLAEASFTLPVGTEPTVVMCSVTPSCAILGCTDEAACNYDPSATEDDGSCDYAFFCFDCDGNCLCDEDGDGVCDPFEFPGCTDPDACNWAPVYTEEDGSCFYAQPGFDCAGFCLPVDNDECGFANPIACGEVVTATTVCADTTESEFCDQYNIGQYYHGGLWYTIMGTGDTLRATLCFEETEYDTYLSIYEGDCGNLDCIAGNDDQDEVNFFADPCFENFLSSSANWESEEGVEYFLHVSGSNAVTPAVGGFDFVLVCDGVEVGACLDSLACNFNPFGTFDDGSCDYSTCAGCGLLASCNYDSTAVINDFDLCDFSCYGCTDTGACNFNPDATIESGLCEYSSCAGCLDPEACNYDATAVLDGENCEYTSCVGCTDAAASNYNPVATEEDGSCTYCDLVLSAPMVSSESCFESGDGMASVAIDSALTDSVLYELTASGFEESGTWTDGVFSALAPGDYLLEVFDGDSTCSAIQVFTIEEAPDVSLFLVASSPACSGGDDGSVTAFVAGNVMATSYQLNGEPADIGGNFNGLAAGDYQVSVNVLTVNGGVCSDTASISVVDPEGMVVTIDDIGGANPNEENGEVSISVTGGVEPYTFEWTGPTGSTGAEDPDDLGAGEWTLEVTGGDGCTTSIVVSVPVGIHEWRAPQFAVVPNPTRDSFEVQFSRPFEGMLELTDVTGRRLNLQWVQSSMVQGSLEGHPAGVYLLRAMDQQGMGAVIRLVKQD